MYNKLNPKLGIKTAANIVKQRILKECGELDRDLQQIMEIINSFKID